MSHHWFHRLLRGCALLAGAAGGAVARGEADDPARLLALVRQPAAEFAARAELDRPVLPGFDRGLLSAALFHETNRVRRAAGLAELGVLPELNRVAETMADLGSVRFLPAHETPFRGLETPGARARWAGLALGAVAENIARVHVWAVDFDRGIGMRGQEGRRVFIDPWSGEPLAVATVRVWARLTVEEWLRSPGHRANILDPEFRHLGCSARRAPSLFGGEMVFAVQEFHVPPATRVAAGRARAARRHE